MDMWYIAMILFKLVKMNQSMPYVYYRSHKLKDNEKYGTKYLIKMILFTFPVISD